MQSQNCNHQWLWSWKYTRNPLLESWLTYHAASVMWYVVKILEMQDTLMEFRQWVESNHWRRPVTTMETKRYRAIQCTSRSDIVEPNMICSSWRLVMEPKAFLTALVIGTILTTINHGDNIILHGEWPVFWKIILTYHPLLCYYGEPS